MWRNMALVGGCVLISQCAAYGMAPRATQLADMEQRFFGCTYASNDCGARLSRLETFIFGASSNDAELDTRFARINKAVVTARNARLGPASHRSSSSPAASSPVPIAHDARTADTASGNDDLFEEADASGYRIVNYRKITCLENMILGKDYAGEPVQDRLSRLEQKAFKQKSNSQDLVGRVDRLCEYAHLTRLPSPDDTTPGAASSRYPSLAHETMPDEIGAMERQVFGHCNQQQPLIDRLGGLEQKVLGERLSNLPMITRIGKLQTALADNRSGDTGDSRSRLIAPSNSMGLQPFTNSDWFNRSSRAAGVALDPLASSPTVSTNTTNGGSKKSIWRRVGHALALAGTFAVEALSGMPPNGYYYGMGANSPWYNQSAFSPNYGLGYSAAFGNPALWY